MSCLGGGSASTAVHISSDLGVIDVELDAAQAPAPVANFLKYVEAVRYTGGWFRSTVTLHPYNQQSLA